LALTPGTRLGVYEITAQIGEGGVGQVYRATDTTLGRQVAIKILPDAFASDPERLAPFEREAKTLASLNHPHIAAIYGFEKSAGLHALVMELVEGPTLAERLAQGLRLTPDFRSTRRCPFRNKSPRRSNRRTSRESSIAI
jgi:serine/threonine protein kinase